MNAKIDRLHLHRLTPVLLMFAVLAFEMSTDIYLPSLPEIAQFFSVPDAAAQTRLSGYLLGFALLGLLAGPLSDSIGRRPVILGSMSIFALGSISCWFAPTMTTLILARFIQGIGAGMAMVVSTAILKDIYDEKNLSRILSTLGIVIALSPMIAPIFGGKIADVWGWKSCFFIIALVATVIWLAIGICLKESLSPEHRTSHRSLLSGRFLLHNYIQLIKRREIITFALISAATYGGLWAWIVAAPFYLINVLGIKSVNYGYYAAIGPGAYIIGTLLNRRCVGFYGVERMLAFGLWLMILGASFALLATVYWPTSLVMLYIPFSVYTMGLAPVFANAVTKAVSVIPSQRGSASALLSTLEMGVSSLCVLIVSLLSNGTLIPCTMMMLASGVLCAWMFSTTAKYSPQPDALTTHSEG
jgi:DHA1 family bicyclomycin/chloramphenicol resistance-like MFS transporter